MKSIKKILLTGTLLFLVFLLNLLPLNHSKDNNSLSGLRAQFTIHAGPGLPTHFSIFQDVLEKNVAPEIAKLGKFLFYEKRLSQISTISCASCHRQKNAFADEKPFSEGMDGQSTLRNTPNLINLLYAGSFFWDLRERNLEKIVLRPILHPSEMGNQNMEEVVSRLASTDYYPPLFKEAFGTAEITEERIAVALKQFVLSLVSGNSKFDKALPFERIGNEFVINKSMELPEFNNMEKLGFQLFYGKARCFFCHSGINFDGNDFGGSSNYEDIGLDHPYTDLGMGLHFSVINEGRFKVPTLRNVELTAPYMHDERFKTLEEVIDFYNEQIKNSKNLTWKLKDYDGNPMRLGLNQKEKEALIAFLKTLTDEEFIRNENYSDPFQE